MLHDKLNNYLNTVEQTILQTSHGYVERYVVVKEAMDGFRR